MVNLNIKNISYESKILIIIILSILVPLVVFTSVSIYSASKAMTKVIKNELEDKSVLVAYDIDKFIAGRITSAKILSQADVLESTDIPKIIQYLTEVVQADEWIEDIDIISPSGEIIASSGEQNEKGMSIIQSQPEVKELFFQATKAQQGDVFVSNMQSLDTGYGIQFITPITDDTNTIVTSILTIEVNIKHIAHIVTLFADGIIGNKHVYIVDNDGKIIVTDNPTLTAHDIFPDLEVNPTLLSAFSLQGSVGSIIYTDNAKDEVMAGYADMSEFGVNKGLDWSIIAIAPLDEITSSVEDMKWLLLAIGIIITIISIFIAYKFTKNITTVLNNIASKANLISQGNYSEYLPERLETKGAIGVLISAFNRMVLNTIEIINKLKEREQYLSITLNSISNAVITTDTNGLIKSMNPEAERLSGFLSAQSIDLPIIEVFPIINATTHKQIEDLVLNVVVDAKERNYEHCLLLNRNRIKYSIAGSVSPIQDVNEKIQGIVIIFNDITAIKKSEEKLQYQAHHDALTHLPNRVLFNDRLKQAIEKAKRKSTIFALLFIDLDHFKEINDSLGHAVGDEILKTVTSRLNETVREEDTVARLGGDEFTVILEDLKEPQDASFIANKILQSLSQSMNVNDNVLYVSSSIGISIYPNDGQSAQNLLKFADSAMYKAKDEGRNNYQYYNSTMTELAFERVVMETSLRDALKNEEFVVYYQPQVSGLTNKLIGMEALVRWQHPSMGLVSPDKFIPLAESTGLIVELDRQVMKIAMTQIVQWYEDDLNPGVLAMNLAVKQLQKEDFLEMLKNMMQETACRAEWIELEVTEGQIMTNPDEAIKILKQISDIGIELAVDDFGTGYSSLAYLKRLPIDKLKIDQAFVRDLPDDEEDAGITKAVIALAQSLNLRVIAEGVETKEQRDFLVENGCDNIQGYFYSKPISADELERKFLKS